MKESLENNDLKEWAVGMRKVIEKLRADDLDKGYCFMIFDDELPGDQAYYEYPDGAIQIEQLDKVNLDKPREIIKILNTKETSAVREKHGVF